MSKMLTKRLRVLATSLWSLGFAIAAADRLSFSFREWQISYAYIFFTLAFLVCLLAEKREFSTRVALYRLHDVAIFGPWRFLLLYFLWASIFSPFTAMPLKSLVFCAGGWFSLLAVGFSAELILCERSVSKSVFVPERLRSLFLAYTTAMLVLFLAYGARLLLPDARIPALTRDPVNLFLYFALGLPFLLWDFLEREKRLAPRFLSAGAIVFGSVSLLAVGRSFFLYSLVFILAALLALIFYKRSHLRYSLISLFGLALAIAVFLIGLRYVSEHQIPTPAVVGELAKARAFVRDRLAGPVVTSWSLLRASRYLGVGLGLSEQKGVWLKVLADAGAVGFLFYVSYFFDLLRGLYRIRHAREIVVSNVALLSVAYFALLGSHYLFNPYGAYIWAWYAIWTVFSAYYRKRKPEALATR